MQKRYYWLKLKKDFFNSIRIVKLRSIAGGDTFTIIYLKMLLYTIDTDGVIQYQGVERTLAEEVALALNEDAENVGLCLNYLCTVGLADARQDEIFLPEAVENVGSEGASAERMRNHRERHASLCDTTVTTPLRLSDGEKEKEKEKDKEKRFTPPSLEEVTAYCQERKNKVDPQKFIDYYTANGWKVGRNPMKDFKAAIRTWEKNTYTNSRERKIIPDYMENREEQAETASQSQIDEIAEMLKRM